MGTVPARSERTTIFIGGSFRPPTGTDTIAVVSPAREEIIGRVPAGTPADIDAAVRAARAAFDEGPWPRLAGAERAAILRRAGELLGEHADALDRLVCEENGTVIRNHQGHVAPQFGYHCGLAIPEPERRTGTTGVEAVVVREPAGVVAAIVPWNAPVSITLAKVLPALLTGCTVVLKPAPETPLDPYVLAEAFSAAGLPPGALNIVTASPDVSETLVRHPGVDKVSFTGSTAAGKRIGALCAEQVKRCSLELGGKSAALLLDDVDLDRHAELVLRGGMLLNNGEACAAWTRILVPRTRQAEAVDAFCSILGRVRVGDPLDPAIDVGPLVSARQRERVEGYVALAKQEGARAEFGGGRLAGLDRGWYVEPTLLVDVDNGMRVAREEIFGPVACVIAYDDLEDGIRQVNDSPYGLAGAIFTSDPARGVALAARFRTGTVGVNTLGYNLAFPFGGYKESGIGRQFGPECLDAYLETKTIGLPA